MNQDATDEQLLARFVGGDRKSLGLLARRYERLLLGLAMGLLEGKRSLACDAVQETWLRLIRFAGSFNGKSSFKTWLYRITVNQCDSLRRARRITRSAELLETVPASEAQPDASAQAGERDERLREAVAALEAEKAVVLLLCYHEGMTHTQAAEILEIPVGTLKSRLHTALEELRCRLPSEVES